MLNELAANGVGDALDKPLVYLIDNSAWCDELTKNKGVSKRTEHFLRWQHYVRWLVYHKYAVVCWNSSKEETGDIMTKVASLGRDVLLYSLSLRFGLPCVECEACKRYAAIHYYSLCGGVSVKR